MINMNKTMGRLPVMQNTRDIATQEVMGMNPFAQYGSSPMDRALETQIPNNAITLAQQSAASKAFGDNMSRQMSVDENITSRLF